MARVLALAILLLGLISSAHAKNPLEELNKALDQINRALQGNPNDGLPSRREPERSVTAGICQAVDRGHKQIFSYHCQAETICNGRNDCDIHYRWNNEHMVTTIRSGRPVAFIGSPVRETYVNGQSCLASTRSNWIFCFIEDDGKTVGDENPRVDEETAAAEREKQNRLRQERETSVRLMETLTSEREIGKFFDAKDLDSLKPRDAVGACQDQFKRRLFAVTTPVPKSVMAGMRTRCVAGADRYGRQVAERIGSGQAEEVLASPQTLTGLKARRWFRFDDSKLADLAPAHHDLARRKFAQLTDDYRNKAFAEARREIEKAYKDAVPLTESSQAAWALCNLGPNAPKAFTEQCGARRQELSKRIHQARCDRAIEQSGASRRFLDREIEASGSRYESWTVRRMLCAGVKNRPDYRIVIDEAWFPKLAHSTLRVFDSRDDRILEVALRVSTPRDGRSFGKLLIDIATGENERPVPETLVVAAVRHVGQSFRSYQSDAVIGCVLGFIKCK